MSVFDDWLRMLVGLIVIVNPLLAISAYSTMTEGASVAGRRRAARDAAVTVGVVLSVAALGGEAVLSFFGIGIPEFQVGGGILILLMAVSMMHAKMSPARTTAEEADEAQEREQIGVVPLGIPLLAGPGAISTAVIYAHQGPGWMHLAVMLVEIWLVAGLVWATLGVGERFANLVGKTGLNIATRIMGLLLAAIAVSFIAQGMRSLLPGLGHA